MLIFYGLRGEYRMLFRSFLFLFFTAVSTASSAAIVSFDYTGELLHLEGEDASIVGTFG